ncbi:MAG: DUF3501 family protein [Alphaproteobacteria bacterium]|nr:DUF3501 family protein [Alphaproteobacteria bacterium]
MIGKHEITRDAIMAMDAYAAERRERRREAVALKRNRRMEVGPVAAFYFENYATMWHQVHEMLHIEKGGEAQIADELAAYNPLIPKGRELIATVMFEVDDEVRRRNFLGRLGGIEETAFLRFGGEKLSGVSEADLDRTTADGKASAVQFIHFPFTDAQVAAFRTAGAEVIIGFDHPNYSHMAVMPEAVRAALAEDFD